MAANGWFPSWFQAAYFPPVWFAPGDESQVSEEELRQDYYGGSARTPPSRDPFRNATEADIVRLVEAKWEAIEQVRLRNRPAQSADTPPIEPELPISAPDASLDAPDSAPVRMAMPGPLAATARVSAPDSSASPLASAQTSTEAVPQADDGALQRKRAQQRAALLLLIDELM